MRRLLVSIVVTGAFFGLVDHVQAYSTTVQTSSTYATSTNSQSYIISIAGSELLENETLDSIRIYVSDPTETETASINIGQVGRYATINPVTQQCETFKEVWNDDGLSVSIQPTKTQTQIPVASTSIIPIDSNDCYRIRLNTTSVLSFDIYGSLADTNPNYQGEWSGNAIIEPALVVNQGGGLLPIEQNYGSSYIDIITPEYGTTTATTTTDISIFFSTPITLDFRPTTTRKYIVRDAVTNVAEYVYEVPLSPNSSESLTVNETIVLSEGSKFIEAYYEDSNGFLYSDLDLVFFNVITNTYELATGLTDPAQDSVLLTQNDCTLYDVGCQFQRAIMFLFYPSDNALQRFGNIWQQLSYVVPFGYVTVTLEQLKTLDVNATASFSFGELPFQNIIFDPFRTALAGILWAIFAIYFFVYRLRHIEV